MLWKSENFKFIYFLFVPSAKIHFVHVLREKRSITYVILYNILVYALTANVDPPPEFFRVTIARWISMDFH